MNSSIVSTKEFREDYRKEILAMSNFSEQFTNHILGNRPRQVNINIGVEVTRLIQERFEKQNRVLEKDLADIRTKRGIRSRSGGWLNGMATTKLNRGANIIETCWKTFGELLVVARDGNMNVYIAKAGATGLELRSVLALRSGKLNAKIRDEENLAQELSAAADILGDQYLADAYAKTCTAYFKEVG